MLFRACAIQYGSSISLMRTCEECAPQLVAQGPFLNRRAAGVFNQDSSLRTSPLTGADSPAGGTTSTVHSPRLAQASSFAPPRLFISHTRYQLQSLILVEKLTYRQALQ